MKRHSSRDIIVAAGHELDVKDRKGSLQCTPSTGRRNKTFRGFIVGAHDRRGHLSWTLRNWTLQNGIDRTPEGTDVLV